MKKKRIFSIVAMVFMSSVLFAGNMETSNSKKPEIKSPIEVVQIDDEPPGAWLGISSGINYGGLLAFTGEFKIVNKTALAAYAGLGTWGYKIGADLRFYKNYPRSMYYVVGLARATGIPDSINLTLETTRAPGGEDVPVFIKPVTNLNVGLGFAWKLGRNSRFNLELGYAIKVSSGNGYYVSPGAGVSDTSEDFLNLLRPGGLRLGLGISLGL